MGKATRRRQLTKRRHSRTPGKRYQQQGGLGETHVVFDFDCTLTSTHFAKSFLNQLNNLQTLQNLLTNQVVPDVNPLPIPNSNIYPLNKTIRTICARIVENLTQQQFEHYPSTSKIVIKNDIIRYFFDDEPRFQKLTELLTLLQENGVILHIASRGNRKALLSVLRFIGWTIFFPENKVNARYDDSKQYINKDIYIKNFLDQFNTTVYYFDDDREEHDQLINNYIQDNTSNADLFDTFKSRTDVKLPYFFFNGLQKESTGISIDQVNRLVLYFQNKLRGPAAAPAVPHAHVIPAHVIPPPAVDVENPAMCGKLNTLMTYSNVLDEFLEPLDKSKADLNPVRLLGLLAINPTLTMDHVNEYKKVLKNVKYEPFLKAHESDPDLKTLQIDTVINKFRTVAPFNTYFYGLQEDDPTKQTAVVCLDESVVKALIRGITGEGLDVHTFDVVQLDIDYTRAQPDQIQVRHLKSTNNYICSSPKAAEPSGERKFRVYLFAVTNNICSNDTSQSKITGKNVIDFMIILKDIISVNALFYASLDPAAILMATLFVNIWHRPLKTAVATPVHRPVSDPPAAVSRTHSASSLITLPSPRPSSTSSLLPPPVSRPPSRSSVGSIPPPTPAINPKFKVERCDKDTPANNEHFCDSIKRIENVDARLQQSFWKVESQFKHNDPKPVIRILDYCYDILKDEKDNKSGSEFSDNSKVDEETLSSIKEHLKVDLDLEMFEKDKSKTVKNHRVLFIKTGHTTTHYRSQRDLSNKPEKFFQHLIDRDLIKKLFPNRVYACITAQSTFIERLVELFNYSIPAQSMDNLDVVQINLQFSKDPSKKRFTNKDLFLRKIRKGYASERVIDPNENWSYKIFLMRNCTGCNNFLSEYGSLPKFGSNWKGLKKKLTGQLLGYSKYAMCLPESIQCLRNNRINLLNMFNYECDSVDNVGFCSALKFRSMVTAALLTHILFYNGPYDVRKHTFKALTNINTNTVMTNTNRVEACHEFIKEGNTSHPFLVTRSVESPDEYGLTMQDGKNYKIITLGPHKYAFQGKEDVTAPTINWLVQTFLPSLQRRL